ncbi:hypothetical protein BM526_08305 [Alteromonas mediterranea]|uniref:restriction endonuclease subunit S n=1 Tax=Alteromonas mediterranea TaxID=314275 RepID=UPI0009045259|nr:restriction endonuclease subunit S [Alteromonas mediterranea]APE01841.1 hypothetical protein BM526_08305 [Alteromonas mediterranea]
MSNTWQVVTLKDITDRIGDGLHGTPKYEDNGEYYFINGNNLKNGQIFIDEKTKRASKEEFEKHKKELSDRTVLLSINGTLGNVAFYNNEKVFLGKSACYLNLKNSVDKHFIRYTLESFQFQNYIHTLATGSTIKNVSLKLVRDFQFELPSFETQVSISSYLRVIDEKFAVNTNINQTLEQIAQAIFKSWFVDFEPTKAKIAAREALLAENPDATPEHIATAEQQAAIQAIAGAGDVIPTQQLQTISDLFPNHLVGSELGEIPYGWEVNRLIELINITGGGTPKRSESSFWGGDISWFSVRDVPNSSDIFVTRTEEKITELGLKKSSTKLIPKGSTIITARGTVGKLALVAEDMCMNQSCYAISSDRFGDFYNYFNLRQSVETLQRNTHGAVFDTITTRTFETYSLAYGGDEISSVFDTVVEPIMKRIELNVRQNSLLSEVRDTLLPKLLSGQMQAI